MPNPNFSQSSVPDQDPTEQVGALLGQVEAVIQSAVRSKLHVTLNRSDFRERNIEAQDLLGDIRLKLVGKLNSQQEGSTMSIGNFKAYAATVAFNSCADYLRSCYAERTRLKRCLRRLLEKSKEFEVWKSSAGDRLCGFAAWHHRNLPPVERWRISALILSPAPSQPPIRVRKDYDAFSLQDCQNLVERIFKHLGAPLALDDLVSIAARLAGVRDVWETSDPPDERQIQPSSGPRPLAGQYSIRLTRERLKLLWKAIGELLPWHRIAYLLNMTDGEIDVFPYYGVASVTQIGELLALTDEQYHVLARELGLNSTNGGEVGGQPATAAQKFAKIWNYLPLPDNLIARLLGVKPSQVIGYRSKALERLKRNLRSLH